MKDSQEHYLEFAKFFYVFTFILCVYPLSLLMLNNPELMNTSKPVFLLLDTINVFIFPNV